MEKVLIIAGPSAVGKTTVMSEILSNNSDFELVRSATTREKRQDGYDSEYIYSTRAEFEEYIKNGEMLEYTEYAGNLYGTPKSEIDRVIKEGKYPLMILDLCGVKSLTTRSLDFCVVSIYLWDYPSVIEERLRQRYDGSPDGEARLKSRIAENHRFNKLIASDEISFNAFVRNEEPSDCASVILDFFNSPLSTSSKAQIPHELKNIIS